MPLRRLIFIFALSLAPLGGVAQQPLDNNSILQMSKAGLGDSLIVESINATPGAFSTSPGDLIALKQAGVSERVLRAMVAKASTTNTVSEPKLSGTVDASATASAASEPAADLTGVDELGIYYRDHNERWVKMEPEVVNFRSGGALKSYGTNHIIKEDSNGHIQGDSAQLSLTRSASFLLSMSAGTDPVDFLLLKLRPGAQHSREFRSQTGGVFHSSSGAVRDQVAFQAVRIAPHVYRFTLPGSAPKGEYGILPPGSMNTANAGSGGKIYTFKVSE